MNPPVLAWVSYRHVASTGTTLRHAETSLLEIARMSRRIPFLVVGWCSILLAPLSAQVSSVTAAAPQPTTAGSQLVIYHAGSVSVSLNNVEAAFAKEHPEIAIVDKAGGSVDLARRVTVGNEPADLYASADYKDIDILLKPKYATFTIRLAQGAMVLVYCIDDANHLAKAKEVADPAVPFIPNSNPPSIPDVAPAWYKILAQPGVWIGGGDPGGDPGAYRALMIMQLAQIYYHQPLLYEALLNNSTFGKGNRAPSTPDYRFIYESSALTMAKNDSSIRLARLPAEIALSDSSIEKYYAQASVTIPGLSKDDPPVTIPASRVAWGITLLNSSKNSANAIAFLCFLLTPEKGGALQKGAGPEPIVPALVDEDDYSKVPAELRPLLRVSASP